MAGALALGLCALITWVLRGTAGGRWLYAIGSNAAAARLAGIRVERVKVATFALAGALTAIAAVLNAARFSQVPSNTGLGLEMKVVAAVVVGGAAVTGGVGTIRGTVLGVLLLGAIGPALTFMGVTAYWERALQGAIILAAVGLDAWRTHRASQSAAPRSRPQPCAPHERPRAALVSKRRVGAAGRAGGRDSSSSPSLPLGSSPLRTSSR